MDSKISRARAWRYAVGALLGFTALIALFSFVNNRQPRITVTKSAQMLGTEITLTVVAPTEAKGHAAIDGAFQRVAELEAQLSAHRADSPLARVNDAAGADPVAVPPDLYDAAWEGLRWHRRTKGAFDITIMPLVELWKNAARANRPPTEDELAAARKQLGADQIELDPAAVTIRLPRKGMRLDLGGLGKGFVAEQVAKYLRERHHIADALIAMSGDIRAMGLRADRRPWRVGIQDPRDPLNPNALLTTIELTDMSVSTSGNYQRFVTIQGKRYSHIIDPRTGHTADAVPSVTVIGPDTITTDILDTALSVLGEEEGLKLIARMPAVDALFIHFDQAGKPQLTRSTRFNRFLAQD